MGCDLSKINLYRILQESLQNCNKYANATLIDVELKKKGDSIVLSITMCRIYHQKKERNWLAKYDFKNKGL
jgi:signal transduction histidine kinase